MSTCVRLSQNFGARLSGSPPPRADSCPVLSRQNCESYGALWRRPDALWARTRATSGGKRTRRLEIFDPANLVEFDTLGVYLGLRLGSYALLYFSMGQETKNVRHYEAAKKPSTSVTDV